MTTTMGNLPEVVSPEEWPAARRELLVREKELTRARDRVGEEVFHAYSTYGRGVQEFRNGYQYLDLTALGRQEAWEDPKGRAVPPGLHVGGPAMRLPDEYEA